MKRALGALLMLLATLWAASAFAGEYRIGVLLPLSGPKADKGTPMKNAVELFVDRLNASGGIRGNKVRLVVKDDFDDPVKAGEAARELVKDPTLLAIIGHYYPATAVGAVKVYDEAQIPCLSPNVSAPEVISASRWMFTANFQDDVQGSFMAVYLKEVMKKDNVVVIHTTEPFGHALRDAFVKKAAAIGLKILKVLPVDNNNVSADWVAKNFSNKDENDAIGAVAALTHSESGLVFLPQLRDAGIRSVVFAPNTWTNPKFLALDEKYTSDVYVTSALLWEIANEKATKFSDEYRKKFGQQPPVSAAMAYDSILLLTEGLKELDNPEKKLTPTRAGLRDYLAHLAWQDAVDGASGMLSFSISGDKTQIYVEKFLEDQRKHAAEQQQKKTFTSSEPAANEGARKPKEPSDAKDGRPHAASEPGKVKSVTNPAGASEPPVPAASAKSPNADDAPKPDGGSPAAVREPAKEKPVVAASENRAVRRDVFVSVIKDGRYKTAFTQLVVPRDEYVLKELRERAAKGYVMIADGQPYHLVDVVFVGVDIAKINDINTKDMNWDADMFMWFKWSGDRLESKDIDRIGVINAVKEQSSLLKEDLSKPVKYRALRKRYTLGTAYDLSKFPFDRQALTMTIAHASKNSTHVMLVLDARHMDDGPIRKINPQEWTFLENKFYSNLYEYDSTFGDPDYRLGKGHRSHIYFSSVNVEVDVKRIIQPYLFTFFLPLAIIIGIILLVLWVPLDQFAPRINASISGLVGILVYHMSQKNSFPKVGYVMMADYYFIIAYVFVVGLIISIIATQTLQSGGKKELAKRLNHWLALSAAVGIAVTYSAITFLLGVRG